MSGLTFEGPVARALDFGSLLGELDPIEGNSKGVQTAARGIEQEIDGTNVAERLQERPQNVGASAGQAMGQSNAQGLDITTLVNGLGSGQQQTQRLGNTEPGNRNANNIASDIALQLLNGGGIASPGAQGQREGQGQPTQQAPPAAPPAEVNPPPPVGAPDAKGNGMGKGKGEAPPPAEAQSPGEALQPPPPPPEAPEAKGKGKGKEGKDKGKGKGKERTPPAGGFNATVSILGENVQ